MRKLTLTPRPVSLLDSRLRTRRQRLYSNESASTCRQARTHKIYTFKMLLLKSKDNTEVSHPGTIQGHALVSLDKRCRLGYEELKISSEPVEHCVGWGETEVTELMQLCRDSSNKWNNEDIQHKAELQRNMRTQNYCENSWDQYTAASRSNFNQSTK